MARIPAQKSIASVVAIGPPPIRTFDEENDLSHALQTIPICIKLISAVGPKIIQTPINTIRRGRRLVARPKACPIE